MAEVFEESPSNSNKVASQGDLVFCEAYAGARDFWGVLSEGSNPRKLLVSLDGGGRVVVPDIEIKEGLKFQYWEVKRIIKCDDAVITLKEHK